MIHVADLGVSFETVRALRDVHLDVDRGEFVTVIGPSGCGKTTLLRSVGGLQEPTTGRVRVAGGSPADAQQAGDVGFVFQRHALLPWKTALGNVTYLRKMAGKPPDEAGARELLDTVGLAEFADARPAELSGGMRQRVAVARALHLGSAVLLMDEPFGSLDELTREQLSLELRRLWRATDRTVLFVTHSVPEAVLLGDRCLLMDGPPGEVVERFEVDLPRPRGEELFGTDRFQRQVAAVREALH